MQRTTLRDVVEMAERLAVGCAVAAANSPRDAARWLGVSLRLVHYKVKRYGLRPKWRNGKAHQLD